MMIFFVTVYWLLFFTLQHPTLKPTQPEIFTSRSNQANNWKEAVEVKPEVLLGMHAAVILDVVVNLHGHLDPVKLEHKAGVCYSA